MWLKKLSKWISEVKKRDEKEKKNIKIKSVMYESM